MLAKPDGNWPGSDDKPVVAEMLAHRHSPHWDECYHFLKGLVQRSDLPEDHKEDVTHNTFLSVMRYLPSFHFECRLTTWLALIAHSRITDDQRKQTRQRRHFPPSQDPPDEEDNEHASFGAYASMTVEEQCLINEKMREITSEMIKYLQAHSKPERNRQILQKVLLEQYSLQEAERELDIPISTIRYIVQAVQSYLRENMKE